MNNFEPFKSVFWAPNVHIHTIWSSFIKSPEIAVQRIELPTPDNDFFEVDVHHIQNDKPIVALFHGLEGSSTRPYIRTLMKLLSSKGYSSAAMNFRSCGGKMNNSERIYHSGATDDYHTFFDYLKKQYPHKKIYAVGFSLGANTLVKSLGELEDNHPVTKAVVVSPPFDLGKGSIAINKGFNRIYQYRFMRSLRAKAEEKRKQFSHYPQFTGKTMYEFDDQITAKVHGFKNADDYYTTCSSNNFYASVKRPLLIIHSKKDTICPFKFAPLDILNANSYIETLFTEKGGHVGFIGSKKDWLNRTIINWLER